MATCSSCKAPMLWAVNQTSGRRVPLDPDPDPEGILARIGYGSRGSPIVVHVGPPGAGPDKYAGRRFTTHFATCPEGAFHRRKPNA